MSEIVERLRAWCTNLDGVIDLDKAPMHGIRCGLLIEAADLIATQSAEITKLKADMGELQEEANELVVCQYTIGAKDAEIADLTRERDRLAALEYRYDDILRVVCHHLELPQSESGPADDVTLYDRALEAADVMYRETEAERVEHQNARYKAEAERDGLAKALEKMHRRAQKAESVQQTVYDTLKSWERYITDLARNGRVERWYFRWAIQDMMRAVEKRLAALPAHRNGGNQS